MTTRVFVVGDGLAELTAAFDFARFGVPVTILTEAGADRQVPAIPQSDPQGVLSTWITEVGAPLTPGTAAQCVPADAPHGTGWVSRGDGWVKVPTDSVFGIPSSPLSAEVSQAIGTRAALRAYLDRVKPVLTVGKTQFVADLVTKRLGQRVLETFVEPQVQHLFGHPATEVEVANLAPGLNEAETRAGSLSGAALVYLDRYPKLVSGVQPDIGWATFAQLLEQRLEAYGVNRVTVDEPITVTQAGTGADSGADSGATTWIIRSGEESWDADVLIRASATESLVRHEVSFTHTRPDWWPSGGTASVGDWATSVLGGEADGWVSRTTLIDADEAFTQIRSSVHPRTGAVLDDGTIAVVLEAAGFAGQDPQSVRVATTNALSPADTRGESDAERNAHIDTAPLSSERGLERVIARVRTHTTELRREVLGLV